MNRSFLLLSMTVGLGGAAMIAQQPPPPSSNSITLFKVCGKTIPQPCADKAPVVTYQPDPKYSKEARKKKIQGPVVLGLVVGTDGLPHDIHLVKSLGYGLDETAIEGVRRWRFKPATSQGKPVAVAISIEVDFRDH